MSRAAAAANVETELSINPQSLEDVPSHASARLDDTSFSLLLNFIRRTLFDPLRVYLDLNPVQPAFTPSTSGTQTPIRGGGQQPKGGGKRAVASPASAHLSKYMEDEDSRSPSRIKPEEDEENEDDRKGRLRTGGIGVLKWALGERMSYYSPNPETEAVTVQHRESELPAVLTALLGTPLLWTSLFHDSDPPFCKASSTNSDEAFPPVPDCLGAGQPLVRRSAWSLFLTLFKVHSGGHFTMRAMETMF
jgi:hypothetical protein